MSMTCALRSCTNDELYAQIIASFSLIYKLFIVAIKNIQVFW